MRNDRESSPSRDVSGAATVLVGGTVPSGTGSCAAGFGSRGALPVVGFDGGRGVGADTTGGRGVGRGVGASACGGSSPTIALGWTALWQGRPAEAADYLARKLGVPTVELHCPDYHSFEINITRARTVLGYSPENDIFRMADRAIAHARSTS